MPASDSAPDRQIIVRRTVSDATDAAALAFERIVRETVRRKDVCHVALSGGTTPYLLYKELARATATGDLPWGQVEIFFGDERDVPHDDVESNYNMALRTLLDFVPVQPTRVHPMRGDAADLPAAAAEYERIIRQTVPAGPDGTPVFDLVLLGMGVDGHTASLFPGTEALAVTDKLVTAYFVPVLGRSRMTFTLPLINAAKNVMFLVTGEDKAHAVADLMGHDEAARKRIPSAHVAPAGGKLTFILDQAAAKLTNLQADA
jgi:6-phosphogluconolactonase